MRKIIGYLTNDVWPGSQWIFRNLINIKTGARVLNHSPYAELHPGSVITYPAPVFSPPAISSKRLPTFVGPDTADFRNGFEAFHLLPDRCNSAGLRKDTMDRALPRLNTRIQVDIGKALRE